MKIVCMDCQTENYSDVELLKDKRYFDCERCAETGFAGPADQVENVLTLDPKTMEKDFALVTDDVLGFYSNSDPRPVPQTVIPQLDEEDPLGISEISSFLKTTPPAKVAEVIPSPPPRPKTISSEVSSKAADSREVSPAEAILPQVIPQEPAAEPVHIIEEKQEPVSQAPLFEAFASEDPKGSKRSKLKTSWILIGVALAVVLYISLVGFPLWKTEQSETSAPAVKSPAKAAVAPQKSPEVTAAPSPAAALPATPVKESSPAAAVVPSATPQAAENNGRFTVQVGSHNDLGQANEQAEQLTRAGFEARVVSVEIPNRGRWYRVQSGSFTTREESKTYGGQIIAKGAAKAFVVSALSADEK